jgi:hypothetical protein
MALAANAKAAVAAPLKSRIFRMENERVYDGLRKAGMPEE